ncbi:MAG: DUF1592 domain-containing protein [Bryobacterales bacterium]
MPQSPHFLMRFEATVPARRTSRENAAKLSFFLWDTIPNEWLLGLADKNELQTSEQIEAAAKRCSTPRAQGAMDEFLGQWMRFDRAMKTIRDRKFYPQFNTEMAAAMTEETRRLFHHLVWGGQDFRQFFSADYVRECRSGQAHGLPEAD